jgi:hypothetical protein
LLCLQIPPPKPPPPEMHFIPNPSNTEFIYLVGLEHVVDFLTKETRMPSPPIPFACTQCNSDFTPVWKWETKGKNRGTFFNWCQALEGTHSECPFLLARLITYQRDDYVYVKLMERYGLFAWNNFLRRFSSGATKQSQNFVSDRNEVPIGVSVIFYFPLRWQARGFFFFFECTSTLREKFNSSKHNL